MAESVKNNPDSLNSNSADSSVSPQPDSDLGLYLHIPFCRSKCNYCAFFSSAPNNDQQMDNYVEAICRHLECGAGEIEGRKLCSIYLGGGTPSLLGISRLSRILETINSNFKINSNAEITLEANPESSSLELFKALRQYGLNRISLGAQSFDDDQLAQLGRVHKSNDIKTAIDYARSAGLDNVSLDLIFALPGQTLDSWRDTLSKALECQPDHLSAYGLTYEDGTPLKRLLDQGAITSVLDETYIEMYDWSRNFLADNGWLQYEISNWSRPGKDSLHNQLYWRRDDYLAVGASAHGMINSVRYAIISDAESYAGILHDACFDHDFWNAGLLEERVELSKDVMASDVMIFGLRLMEGVSVSCFKKRFGYSPLEKWGKVISRLEDNGLLEQNEDYIRLTYQAIPVSNEVFVHFLD